MTINVTASGITISGDDVTNGDCVLNTSGNSPVITVKDKPYTLQVIKIDGNSQAPLADAHFAVFRQVAAAGGTYRKDYYPIPGYEDLVSGANGVVISNLQALGAGTYYLVEMQEPDGYARLGNDICFTIDNRGVVTVEQNSDRSLARTENNNQITYTLTVINTIGLKKVSFQKVDIALTSRVLSGAVFDLYRVTDGHREAQPMISDMTSNNKGILACGNLTVFELGNGVYHLIEKQAPDGYLLDTDPVVVTITQHDVVYDEGTNLSSNGSGIAFDSEKKVYTLKISNSSGYALPSAGGYGNMPFIIIGLVLMVSAAVMQYLGKRRIVGGDC